MPINLSNSPAEERALTPIRSTSSCPPNSTASTPITDASPKITLTDPIVQQDTWSADTETDLLNIEDFKVKRAQAKHWKELKTDLKGYMAKMKSDAISKKFEKAIKDLG
jgi:hypothetical protein